MRAIAVGVAVLGIVLAAGCGGRDDSGDAAEATSAAQEPVTVELLEENESGQTGTATLTDRGLSGTGVVLKVTRPDRYPGDVQPASINEASCAEVDAAEGVAEQDETVTKVLTEVRDGRSETTSAKSLAELTSGAYSINVYQQNPPYVPVACGEIPTR